MQELPEALAPFAEYRQFCLYKLVPSPDIPGRMEKKPCNHAGEVWNPHDPEIWLDADTALKAPALYGPEYGTGFVFTADDPFYFFDLDNCLRADGKGWSAMALDLMARLPGAAVEVSQSGTGLHIFGRGTPTVLSDKRRKKAKHPETGESEGLFDLYTERRFAALTGLNVIGSVNAQAPQDQLDWIVDYWLKRAGSGVDDWTDGPVEGWTGPEDDDELIKRALNSKSAGSAFGSSVSFKDLWDNNEDVFAEHYPDDHGSRAYDLSRPEAALAQHLAFWTGNDCERILRLLWKSGMVRDKWDRPDYLPRTIEKAVSMQETVYSVTEVDDTIAGDFGAVKLQGSEAQVKYAQNVRAQKLIECAGEEEPILKLCRIPSAKFWIDAKDKTVEQIIASITPIEAAADPLGNLEQGPQLADGYQYMGATLQIEHFAGCVYVQDAHKVLTPSGAMLKSEQFNATYGGYCFQLNDGGDKTTRKAWDAFTESQLVRYPKAEVTVFRPRLKPGELVEIDKRIAVNTYVPIDTPRKVGDVKPFLDHLAKVLPDEHDREILLAYMAACAQYKGYKFQWAPLLQGVEGNGKTLFTRCVAFAVGSRYTHLPPANEIAEKYNDWLFDNLFIGVEDIYVPDHKKEIIEVIKPMITSDDLSCRAMQMGQVMRELIANFMLNSNHKDGLRKTLNDRRFATFFTAQQTAEDVKRAGMGGAYFPKLYAWLKRGDGYAMVGEFLATYPIPLELNPAVDAGGLCHRAPETSTTAEAVAAGMGGVEQEILEAVEEGRVGFCGGWISSVAIERLLQSIHATRTIPINKRREMLQALGYDWHPALPNGRANNDVPIDGNKKPRLFIQNKHLAHNLKTPGEVVKAYIKAQELQINKAADTFNNGQAKPQGPS